MPSHTRGASGRHAVGTAGDILVVEEDRAGFGALFRVNPMNGSRSRLSDFANPTQGQRRACPTAWCWVRR